jgi:hypothetical protein
VEVKGQPIRVYADIELYATHEGCCYHVDQRASARVPLLGSRIEKFAVAQALEGAGADMDYLASKLP